MNTPVHLETKVDRENYNKDLFHFSIQFFFFFFNMPSIVRSENALVQFRDYTARDSPTHTKLIFLRILISYSYLCHVFISDSAKAAERGRKTVTGETSCKCIL